MENEFVARRMRVKNLNVHTWCGICRHPSSYSFTAVFTQNKEDEEGEGWQDDPILCKCGNTYASTSATMWPTSANPITIGTQSWFIP